MDTLGLMHGLVVTPASVQDRDMIGPMMDVVRRMCTHAAFVILAMIRLMLRRITKLRLAA